MTEIEPVVDEIRDGDAVRFLDRLAVLLENNDHIDCRCFLFIDGDRPVP